MRWILAATVVGFLSYAVTRKKEQLASARERVTRELRSSVRNYALLQATYNMAPSDMAQHSLRQIRARQNALLDQLLVVDEDADG